MGGLNGPSGQMVQLVPIQRLNAVLAISHQMKYLEHLRAWVTRLDRPGQGSDKRIYVYNVQNGRASDLANTLGKLLFGGSGVSGGHAGSTPGGSSRDDAEHRARPAERRHHAHHVDGFLLDADLGERRRRVRAGPERPGLRRRQRARCIGEASRSPPTRPTPTRIAITWATPQQYGTIEQARCTSSTRSRSRFCSKQRLPR